MKISHFLTIALVLTVTVLLYNLYLLKQSSLNPATDHSAPPLPSLTPTTPTPTPLPKEHLIKTPFVPQAPEGNWNQPWQDACEEAALLIPHYYYQNQTPNTSQIKQDILALIDYQHQQDWGKDINLDQMAQIGQDYLGYQAQILNDPSLDDIKHFLLQNIPVIIPANGKILFQENRHFNNQGPYYHNLVILGFNDSKNQFTVHDVGTRHGAYFKYSYSLLMASIHDFPSSGRKQDINQGSPRMLILLK